LRKQWHRRPSDPLRDYLKHNFRKEEDILSINPMMFLQFKNSWQTFIRNHPKFPAFWRAVYKHGIQENMIIEFKVTEPDGKELASNIRVTKSDLELFENLKKMITDQ
jgi:hypothetical protein